MKLIHLLSKILPFLTLIFVAFYVFATNELVSVGRSVKNVDTVIAQTQADNETLRRQVASASALWVIEEKAHTLGYQKPASFVTIGQEAVALR